MYNVNEWIIKASLSLWIQFRLSPFILIKDISFNRLFKPIKVVVVHLPGPLNGTSKMVMFPESDVELVLTTSPSFSQRTNGAGGIPLFFKTHWQVAFVCSLMYPSWIPIPSGQLMISISGGAVLVAEIKYWKVK